MTSLTNGREGGGGYEHDIQHSVSRIEREYFSLLFRIMGHAVA
jgi:hypothetical protein